MSSSISSLCVEIQGGAQPSFDDIYDAFVGHLQMLSMLKDTPQDPIWHAEGDVHIHSRMTVEALYKVMAEAECDWLPHERLQLVLGSAFHDIAKAITTKEEEIKGDLRIVAPRHAEKGRSYLAPLLCGLPLSHRDQMGILSLVGYHHDPRRMVRRASPSSSYWKLARLCDLSLLEMVCLADTRGRICTTQEDLFEDLELFSLFRQDSAQGLQPSSREWSEIVASEIEGMPELMQRCIRSKILAEAEAGVISTPYEGLARTHRYRTGFGTLHIACGPSGLGKSTWFAKNYPNAKLISMDQLRKECTGSVEDQSQNGRVLQLALKNLKYHLAHKHEVVWDATSLLRSQRQRLIGIAEDYHAFALLHVFVAPLEEAIRGNNQRTHQVPKSIIHKQYKRWELPTKDEAHEVYYRLRSAKGEWQPISP